jgi:hypothetical protein
MIGIEPKEQMSHKSTSTTVVSIVNRRNFIYLFLKRGCLEGRTTKDRKAFTSGLSRTSMAQRSRE